MNKKYHPKIEFYFKASIEILKRNFLKPHPNFFLMMLLTTTIP